MSWLDSWKEWRTARRARRITYTHALDRVARGAAYLDDFDPGWHERIDAVTLELRSGTCCILGQLHGEFRTGLSRAQLIDLSSAPRANLAPWSYGFQCEPDLDDATADQDYAYLNLAWQTAIAERQAFIDPPLEQPPVRRVPSERYYASVQNEAGTSFS